MSTTTNGRHGAVNNGGGPALLYPTLLIAGIAVIIVSMLGIAAMTGLLPQAQSESQTAVERPASGGADGNATPRAKAAAAKSAAGKTAPPAMAAARCGDCGVVDSIRAVEVPGQSTAVGAVAGGVVGGLLGNQVGGGRGRTAMTVVGAGAGAYAGNEIEKNINKSVSYEIRVRMEDNTYRTIRAAQPVFDVGQHVKVSNGQLVSAG